MKIGILTFHRAYNFGAVLQCYAMQEFLKSCGHSAQVVDYKAGHVYDIYKLIRTDNWKQTIKSFLHLRSRMRTKRIYQSFIRDYLCVTNKKFERASDFNNEDFDCFIIGSDQVWSTKINHGLNPVFWGSFARTVPKIVYGASMGSAEELGSYNNDIKSKLYNFKAIAAREKWLADSLAKLFDNRKVEWVVDPTLMADSAIYEKILTKPEQKNYVLYYQREYHPNAQKRVEEVARQLGCMVIVLTGGKDVYGVPYKYFDFDKISVPLFLGLFKYAKFVFSASFHGTAFSLVFRKDFYFLMNGNTERSASLMQAVGAADRMISPDRPVSFSKVDYALIEKRLDNLVKHSRSFLLSAIENL